MSWTTLNSKKMMFHQKWMLQQFLNHKVPLESNSATHQVYFYSGGQPNMNKI